MDRNTHVSRTQMLTGSLQFYHIRTPQSIIPTANVNSEKLEDQQDYYAQARVQERILEVLRSRANPVIVGQLEEDGFSLALEHVGLFDAATLEATIRELGVLPFARVRAENGATVDLSKVEVLAQDGLRLAVAETGVGAKDSYANGLTSDPYSATIAPTAGDPFTGSDNVVTPTNLGKTNRVTINGEEPSGKGNVAVETTNPDEVAGEPSETSASGTSDSDTTTGTTDTVDDGTTTDGTTTADSTTTDDDETTS